jgi:hypothetical protein
MRTVMVLIMLMAFIGPLPTVLGFLPGIEYIYSEKWSFSVGCAFDTIGKFGTAKITPAVSMY